MTAAPGTLRDQEVSISVPTLGFDRPEDPGAVGTERYAPVHWGSRGQGPVSVVAVGGLLAGLAFLGALSVLAWDAL